MSERVAILVIHGMGAHKPYQALDQFARGVQKILPEAKNVTYASELRFRQHKEDLMRQQRAWTQAFVRLTPSHPAAGAEAAPDPIDLLEYHWAPIINGRVNALQSLRFLILTALSPFNYLRSNMLVIDQVAGLKHAAAQRIKREGFSNSKIKQIFFILWREFCRSVLIFFPFILLLTGLYLFLAEPLLTALTGKGESTWLGYFWAGPKPGLGDAFVLVFVGLRWLLIGMACKYLLDVWRHPEAITPAQKKPLLYCDLAVGALLLVLVALPFVLHGVFHLAWPRPGPSVGHSHPALHAISGYCSNVWKKLAGYLHYNLAFAPLRLRLTHLAIYAGLALLVYLINLFLTTAIGGLAVYLGSDERSTNFSARSEILSESMDTVTALLDPQIDDLPPDVHGMRQYDRVLIVAHSLGSVIAYDVLNDLMVKHLASGTPVGLQRITGLFTFGCPLNKTYYFFRRRTDAKTTILNGILFKLHNFRLRVSGPEGARPIPSPFAETFRWFNAWSPFDVISGRMLFYQADENRKVFTGCEPATAHLGYWKNPDLYRFFSGLL